MKVTAVCWSPNGKKLAMVTTDRVVHMFDEKGDRQDKFGTKPAEKVSHSLHCDLCSFNHLILH